MQPTTLQLSLIEKEAKEKFPSYEDGSDNDYRQEGFKEGALSTLEKQGKEAVEFAEWVAKEKYRYKANMKTAMWYRYSDHVAIIHTTQELYALFIQSKNK